MLLTNSELKCFLALARKMQNLPVIKYCSILQLGGAGRLRQENNNCIGAVIYYVQ